MSVDFPAPLSPTRPHTSPGSTSRLTPFSACTLEYHLCRFRTEIRDAAISALHLNPACRPSQPRIHHDSKYRKPANGAFEPVSIDLRQHKAIVDHTNEQCADNSAWNRADAAPQCGAADHCCSDGLQLEAVADRRKRRPQPEDLNRSPKSRQHRAHHKACHFHPPNRNSHRRSSIKKTARCPDPITEIRAGQHHSGNQCDNDEPDERGTKHSAGPNELREHTEGQIACKQGGESAGD